MIVHWTNSLHLLFHVSILTLWKFRGGVFACGGFFCQPNQPVVQNGEAIVFAMDETTITMHVQILYEGPAEEFSWVLPLPGTNPLSLSLGTDVLFQSLFESTRPTFVLDVANALSESCTLDQVMPFLCPLLESTTTTGSGGTSTDNNAIVVQQGSVGPFEFVVLQAADSDPSSVFEWLEANGYDQPEGADALLNYYALQGMQFVALRLRKDTERGEIEPIVLTYDIPEALESSSGSSATQMARRALACVPIQLTSIAASDNMPIQVYVLGSARAVPLNYLELELDDTQVDWVGCFNNDTCYDADYRRRFQQATTEISEHSFVTEYAGSTDILQNRIAVNVSLTRLAEARSPQEFLQILANANVPDTRRVITLIDQYIPPIFPEDAPGFCDRFVSAYAGPANGFGIVTQPCLWNYSPSDSWLWDPAGLTRELQEKVFAPAEKAQDMVMQYRYLTRLYAQLSPNDMTKDPFFALKPELPDVSAVHSATAIPSCAKDGVPFELEISVEGYVNSFVVPATLGCNGWYPTEPMVLNDTSAAQQVASWGFPEDGGMLVPRSPNGRFDFQAVQAAIDFGDSLVINQTIPEFFATNDSSRPTLISSKNETKNITHGNLSDTTTSVNSSWTKSEQRPGISSFSPSSASSVETFDVSLSPSSTAIEVEDNIDLEDDRPGEDDTQLAPKTAGMDTSDSTREQSLACMAFTLVVAAIAFWNYW